MRIAYIVSSLKKGGPTNQLFNILNNCSSYEKVLFTLSHEPEYSDLKKFQSIKDLEIIQLRLSRVLFPFLVLPKLIPLIKSKNIDCIHSQGIRGDLLNLLIPSLISKKNIKSIATLRTNPNIDYSFKYGRLVGNMSSIIHNFALRRLDYTVCCSKNLFDQFDRNDYKNITYIQNGVDTSNNYPSNKDELRKELNLKENHTYLISVGHLEYQKNPELILDSFISFSCEKEKISLIFVGTGSELNKLKGKARKHNENIHFTGRIDNVSEYLKASDMFISASRLEGLPNTVLEAGACGLRLILSNIPPHLEIAQELPENERFIFEEGDMKSLCKQLNEAFKYSVNKVLISESISNRFSAVENSRQYSELYKS
ncbi:glycosyltransferase [Marivirga tractuosa]|uniref:Glycosyl transferase group 1 n=1 Tax=Marivirga tractuosa (strain ATCC 23168 / DSM 4126 / NBRC 15989 / NCIMB 1408 / VKM B-1430 / H-43) TaxID=643867 RepID=E4TQB3_MARTH|nr:glycosyltransferase [Marivirga tractuosa]ADR22636.1 glycosyl transferase group 1 [Marivirga tractuosa DSM 4126]BDD16693.1 glycosyltransferase [Marivirga tractuosa]